MNAHMTTYFEDLDELKEYLKNNNLSISIEELLQGFKVLSSDTQYLKMKVRTNIKLIGKDPDTIEELFKLLVKDPNFEPIIEVLIISDFRKKHDNTMRFKYLLRIPFTLKDKLNDGTFIIDNMDLEYTYDQFLETSYLTLKFDETKIPNLIYTVNKNNISSFNEDLYKPVTLINCIFFEKLKNMRKDSRKH